MTKKLIPALAAASLLIPGLASAVEIGTVRAQEVVQQSPQYEEAEQRMRSDFEERASTLQAEARQLQSDIETFQKEADLMAADARQEQEQELTTRQRDFQLKQKQFREDVSNRERELFEELMGEVRDIIEKVAREKGLDLIVSDPVYAKPSMDLTDEVLRRLSQQAD
ncbi:OmpH family outer membrane protein [Algiphilus aromaticivorans]|uniref:OmpH family outer membrane protein n=1 Tax=Algiphilus aromaticivorans TaxID=382454 RepID=UPI0005C1D9E7|nr:OmpH family outer membrane protein [Algiphilus aromaticivorans]